MKIMRKLGAVICGAMMVAGLVWGCAPRHEYVSVSREMLGTTMHLTADVEGVTQQEVFRMAGEVDAEAKASMSIFDPTSLLSRINANRTDSVDAHIAFNLRLADSVSRLCEGRYDVTVKPLVEAWGFAGKEHGRRPNVDSLLEFVGYDKVKIENGRLVKADERMQLDFNSIAKGYTVDMLAHRLEELGAKNYMVEIGGEVVCKGLSPKNREWRIGVETPFDGNMTEGDYLTRVVQINEGALATSGNYRRFYLDADGRKVAHTIDPRTGCSVLSRLLSATVVAPTCAEADAFGTMFMALGADDAMAFVEKHPHMKVLFIFAGEKEDDYEVYISPAMQPLILE